MKKLTLEQAKVEVDSCELVALKSHIYSLFNQESDDVMIQLQTKRERNMIFGCLLVISNIQEDYSTIHVFQSDSVEQNHNQYHSYTFSYQEAVNLTKLLNIFFN